MLCEKYNSKKQRRLCFATDERKNCKGIKVKKRNYHMHPGISGWHLINRMHNSTTAMLHHNNEIWNYDERD